MVSSCIQQLEDLKQRSPRGRLIIMHVPWPHIEVCLCHWQCFTQIRAQTQPNPTWPPPTLLNSNWVKCFNGTTAGDNLVLQEKDFPARLQLKCSVIAYCFICRESAKKKSNQTYPQLFFHDSEQHAIRKLMKLIFKMVKTWKEWEKYSDKVRNWILIDFW